MDWWALNRSAAIIRHQFVWAFFEFGDPDKWDAHMDIVNLVYGKEEK